MEKEETAGKTPTTFNQSTTEGINPPTEETLPSLPEQK